MKTHILYKKSIIVCLTLFFVLFLSTALVSRKRFVVLGDYQFNIYINRLMVCTLDTQTGLIEIYDSRKEVYHSKNFALISTAYYNKLGKEDVETILKVIERLYPNNGYNITLGKLKDKTVFNKEDKELSSILYWYAKGDEPVIDIGLDKYLDQDKNGRITNIEMARDRCHAILKY